MERAFIPEILWANIYHDTIVGSEWLQDKTISPGGPYRWAVGYNFLYALYRVLDEMRPQHILELGLGQSTRLTGQYARYFGAAHFVVEHDKDWVNFFCNSWRKMPNQTIIYLTELVQKELSGNRYCAYKEFDNLIKEVDTSFELIMVDGPIGGSGERSRRDIVAYLPNMLSEEFVILIDDCGRKGEDNLIREIREILNENNIQHSFGLLQSGAACHVGIIACKKWRFFASM